MNNEIFTILDNRPKPVGGMSGFFNYVAENLTYPEEAKKAGIGGKVFVEFVVDKNGKLTEVKVVKGVGHGCDEEAIRVLKEAPNWIPGNVADINVSARMILPITYKLG